MANIKKLLLWVSNPRTWRWERSALANRANGVISLDTLSTLMINFPPRKISKKKFIPKSHELEHSAEVEIFPLWWKIFHFEKFPKKKIYSKITWIGSFCIEKFFPKNRKFFHFFQKLENSANLFIRAYNWTKFQRKIFSQKMGIQVVGFWAKNPNFQTWNRIFFQFSEKKSLFSKIRKFYIPWPLTVPSFSEIKETFFLHSFIIMINSASVQCSTYLYD